MSQIAISKKLVAFGSKKIYLPKFTVALVRTKDPSPYHARFLVPLDFSKFDLRDYLYHAYNVRCFNIRSNVVQMPVRDTQHQQHHWFREESKKYMNVELEEPFVWPEVPNMKPWGKKERNTEVQETTTAQGVTDARDEREAARRLRAKAEEVLNIRDPKARRREWERQRPEKHIRADKGSFAIKA